MTTALDRAIDRHRRGDVAGAHAEALAALQTAPDDVELLHFAGMIEMATGQAAAARAHLAHAVALQPQGFHTTSLARLLAREDPAALAAIDVTPAAGPAGDELLSLRAEARARHGMARDAALDLEQLHRRRPEDRGVAMAAAVQLADAGEPDRAETIYAAMLERSSNDIDALLGLVGIHEALGQPEKLEALFAQLGDGADPKVAALGAMFKARSERRFGDARTALVLASGLLPRGTEEQIAGDLADRDGDAAAAFTHFSAMNRIDAAETPEWREGVDRYRAMLADSLRVATGARLPRVAPDGRPAPLFLLGFPRSGTTLLDTFLMGHDGFEVHEERPFLDLAAAQAQPDAARREYRRALDTEARRPHAVQVDKYPLASARAPLISGMFPDAKYIFALRHPCDVVLSCFMTRFRLNWGVSAFLHMDDAVDVYGKVMTVWIHAREQLALDVHEVRYERLIAEPEAVLRGVATFAGLPFEPGMLEHRSTAKGRGMISTPSHAQVVEPLYRRAIGRWHRYRAMLDPYLPALAPWCERFGYTLDADEKSLAG